MFFLSRLIVLFIILCATKSALSQSIKVTIVETTEKIKNDNGKIHNHTLMDYDWIQDTISFFKSPFVLLLFGGIISLMIPLVFILLHRRRPVTNVPYGTLGVMV